MTHICKRHYSYTYLEQLEATVYVWNVTRDMTLIHTYKCKRHDSYTYQLEATVYDWNVTKRHAEIGTFRLFVKENMGAG